jgi:hypothetical protein
VAAVLAWALMAAACGGAGGAAPPVTMPASRSAPGPAASPAQAASGARGDAGRIALLVMENKEYGQVLGSPDAPFLNAWPPARSC